MSSTPASSTLTAVGASVCASGSQVCSGHIGIFTAKADDQQQEEHHRERDRCPKEGNRARDLSASLREMLEGRRLAAGLEVDQEDARQGEDRADQRVDQELPRGVLAPRAAPDADQQEHRDQLDLPEEEEQEEIERGEDAHHAGFQEEQQRHVELAGACSICHEPITARKRQQRVEDEHRDAQAVGAERVIDAEVEAANGAG